MIEQCPHCDKSLQGEPIPASDLMKGYYGKWDGVTPQFFSRKIGVEIPERYDGVAYWACPFCGGTWPRKGHEHLYPLGAAQ